MIRPHRRSFLGGLCSCSLLGLAGCVTTGDQGPITPGYKPAADTDEGGLWYVMNKVEHDMQSSRHRIRDKELHGYLVDVVQRLSKDYSHDMRVYLMRTPYFNASMAPNGMMTVWSGLLLRVDDEAQLAAILGHEMGHYMRRHTLARIRDMRSKADVGAFLGGLGLVGGIAQLTLLASNFAYARDQEREADQIGLELMSKAGYRPQSAADVWQQIIDESKADKDAKSEAIMFATHPTNEERLETLRTKAAEIGTGGETFATRYHERIARIRFMLLDDEVRLHQYDRTLVVLKRLQGNQPGDGELIYFEGEVYRLRDGDGDRKLASGCYERAIGTGSSPPQAWRSLGLVQMKDGKKQAAHQSFDTYLKLLPDAEDRIIIKSYMDKMA